MMMTILSLMNNYKQINEKAIKIIVIYLFLDLVKKNDFSMKVLKLLVALSLYICFGNSKLFIKPNKFTCDCSLSQNRTDCKCSLKAFNRTTALISVEGNFYRNVTKLRVNIFILKFEVILL